MGGQALSLLAKAKIMKKRTDDINSAPRFFIRTFGCQMNAYDSEVISSRLEAKGLTATEDPANADLLIVNTCSIREHAEMRAMSWIHDLSRHQGKLVVCGCMAQRYSDRLREMITGIDMVVGPDNYDLFMDSIDPNMKEKASMILTKRRNDITYSVDPSSNTSSVSRYLSVTRGCENFCTYCVVPYLRGEVRSKLPESVLDEARTMIAGGAKEITLLGQNVLAYESKGIGFTGLADLLLRETDIKRLRFLTTHPKDVDEKLFEMMSGDSRLCPHIHLPVQSGSDRILSLMNRPYSRGKYLSIVERAREIMPDLSITTDIIVGFPTETEKDFNDTMEIVESARFDSAFTFKYSPREGTEACKMKDNVPDETKKERLAILNSRISEVRKDIHSGLVGSIFQILLDGTVKKRENLYLKGRTPHFRNVIIEPGPYADGELIDVVLKRLIGFTFLGGKI